jgi:hypothetical protein
MIFVEPVRNCATKQEANWSRSNSCLATFRCKPPSVTWDANNVFAMQSTIASAWNRALHEPMVHDSMTTSRY